MNILSKALRAGVEQLDAPIVEVPEVQHVTDEEINEAHAENQTISDVYATAKRELQDYLDLKEEVESQTASLENYVETLKYGLEAKEFSPTFAVLASKRLAQYAESAAVHTSAVGIESYSGDTLEDFYTDALEGFTEVLTKIGKALANSRDKMAKSLRATFNNWEKIPASYNRLIDRAIADLNSVELQGPVTVKLGKAAKVLNNNGAQPASYAKAIQATGKAVENYIAVVNGNLMQNTGAVETVVRECIGLDSEPGKVYLSISNHRSDFVSVFTGIEKSASYGDGLLGIRVEVVPGKVPNKALRPIEAAWEEGKKVVVAGADVEVELTPQQLSDILVAAKEQANMFPRYSELMDAAWTANEKVWEKIRGYLGHREYNMETGESRESNPLLRTEEGQVLADLIDGLMDMCYTSYNFLNGILMKQQVEIIDAALDLVKRAAK